MIEDKLLIIKFKQGHREALRQIYDKYKVELLKLSVVLLGDVNTAEDVVHDVFVKFAQSAGRIKVMGNLKNYLITSVINRVRNFLRDRNRHSETSLEGIHVNPSSDRGPQQWAILGEQLKLLSGALNRLPYEQREVICFHMEMDMTFRQIAKLQNTSVNTVKGRYRYGMDKLRSILNSEVQNEIRR
jgi:RNA polymerase sigma-70 factor (ECF subfamily)